MKFSSLQTLLRLILVNVIISYQILRCQSFSTSLHVEDGSIRSSGGESSSTGIAVSVFDNVIPPSSQDMLHVAASESGLGHKVFSRPIVNRDESPIIELALDAILTEMEQGGGEGSAGVNSMEMSNDNNVDAVPKQYVEYWTRQEFRHIEAHADVDEHLAKEHDASIANGEMTSSTSPPYRYPENGHVLYLKVGSEVQGPTCIFPKTSTGGQLIQKQEQQEGDDKDAVDLIVVPAVNGRLLRFSGSALHAVPRPPDLWFLSFVKGAPKFKPEEEWGRSVILFNTWSGEEDPPKDVPAASRRSGTNTVMSSESMVNKREDWKDIFLWKDDNNKDKTCTREDNNIIDEATASKVKIWLLGNERRRDYPMRTIKMKAKSSARDAFLESTAVSHLTLEP